MQTVKLIKENDLAWLVLFRPEQLNALNEQMLRDIEWNVTCIKADKSIRCLIIRGEGDVAFAAGADIKEMESMDFTRAKQFSDYGSSIFEKISKLEIPVIAAINGFAFGGGLELALACDFRIASENAVMGLPEVGLGIMPGWGGSKRLKHVAGYAAACEMVFTGKRIDAAKALELGVVNAVFPIGELNDSVRTIAERICRNAPMGIKNAKRVMQSDMPDFASSSLFGELFCTADQRMGMKNFCEKVKTERFEGK